MFILLAAGCGASYDPATGLAPTRILDLRDGFDFSVTVEKNEVLALDLRMPARSGHSLVGASFDPAVLRLDRYLERDGGNARYLFTAMENGLTDVLIKMEPEGGGDAEVYKRVSVTVGKRSTLF
ncbi:hypothetical protein [Pseudodesulfovibrio pelocollis]|uniref:hypothetical protein n=1 Tax=Pseudodesulfovibrio pelocollis TaxID=3051432 RepID=UPI00255A9618|nr:hypothetical protein [Pseudodesulfovibrio sp. SB368]